MLFGLYEDRADARLAHPQIVKQFLVIVMATVVLTLVVVSRCEGSVANTPGSLPTTSTTTKTPKISGASTPSTTPIRSAVRQDVTLPDINWNDPIVVTIVGATISAGALIAAYIIAGNLSIIGLVVAAVIGGWFGLAAAGIGIIPGMLGVAVTIAIALGLL